MLPRNYKIVLNRNRRHEKSSYEIDHQCFIASHDQFNYNNNKGIWGLLSSHLLRIFWS
jgi:hypothetical protein